MSFSFLGPGHAPAVLLAAVTCAACSSSPPASPVGPPLPDRAGSPRSSGDDGSSGTTADVDGASADDSGGAVAMSFDFTSCTADASSGDFPLDVGGIVRRKCQPCHGQPLRHGAPFPELDYEDVLRTLPGGAIPIWQRMAYVIQPGAVPHMPLSGPQLADAELQTLDDWFAQCAPPVPEGTGADLDTSAFDGGPGSDASDAASDAPGE